jgi:hypothetical protein
MSKLKTVNCDTITREVILYQSCPRVEDTFEMCKQAQLRHGGFKERATPQASFMHKGHKGHVHHIVHMCVRVSVRVRMHVHVRAGAPLCVGVDKTTIWFT